MSSSTRISDIRIRKKNIKTWRPQPPGLICLEYYKKLCITQQFLIYQFWDKHIFSDYNLNRKVKTWPNTILNFFSKFKPNFCLPDISLIWHISKGCVLFFELLGLYFFFTKFAFLEFSNSNGHVKDGWTCSKHDIKWQHSLLA